MCEQSRRYEEMRQTMKKIVLGTTELTIEERNLLSVAYKNLVSTGRNSWRVFTLFEHRETTQGNQELSQRIEEIRTKIEKELREVCFEIIGFVDDKHFLDLKDPESKVFFHKMKGDYCRYSAEFLVGKERDEMVQKSLFCYQEGSKIADQHLQITNSLRLGLFLNFSVLYYENLNDFQQAYILAKKTFEEAIDKIDSLSDKSYHDASLVLRLLRDNLNSWSKDMQLPNFVNDSSNYDEGDENQEQEKDEKEPKEDK
ncbi:14-3-3 protein epsilon [Anaeramoeba ignava]|uniref:14-3-3 protein epsilon n=1 Tax=Anaeramoeba ignava TaxID=1746090 RepID=A0A9Q0LUY5_ANAIG|nr:14-3-3 protein epsilon [Anaeramoeba ignava]